MLRARDLVVQGANGTTDASGRARDRRRDRPAHRLDQDRRQHAVRRPLHLLRHDRRTTPPYQLGATTPTPATPARSRARSARASRSPSTSPGSSVIGDGSARPDRDAARDLDRPAVRATPPRSSTTDLQRARRRARHVDQRPGDGRRARRTGSRRRSAGCSSSRSDAPQLLSDTEDADMAQTIDRLTRPQQAVYQAALKAGAQIIQPSLMDFLAVERRRALMQIESTRFGTIEIRDDAVLTFPDGLIGLARHAVRAGRAATTTRPSSGCTRSTTRRSPLPVTNPWLFFGDYEVRVSDDDAERLGLDEPGAGRHPLRRRAPPSSSRTSRSTSPAR